MRRVGEKAPLRVEGAFEPREQRVDLVHERQELARHIVGGQRIEPRGVAVAHAPRGDVQRLQAARQGPGDDDAEHRDEQQHRHQHAERELARERVAGCDRLADLDGSFVGDVRIDAPRALGGRGGDQALLEALRQVRRQRRQRGLEVDSARAVVGADREREAGPRDAQPARLGPVFAQVHRVRDLLQLLVEQPPDLVARQGIGGAQDHHGPQARACPRPRARGSRGSISP